MIKKKYIRPEVEIIELEPITMLAISSEGNLNVKDDEPEEELSNRRRNYWSEVGRRE